MLLKGTVVDGLSDWDHGRNQPVRFIDFEHPENNDFLVINQFKAELTSGRGHVIPDAVLFVNGIPLVVAEFKSPGIENPLHEAIDQLLRYSNQRRELFPTLYTENDGVERLFATNQLPIASDFFEVRGKRSWNAARRRIAGSDRAMAIVMPPRFAFSRLRLFPRVVANPQHAAQRGCCFFSTSRPIWRRWNVLAKTENPL